MTLKKPEIAERLAKETGLSVNRAMKVLNTLFSTRKGMIVSELDEKGEFRVAGFGTFSIRERRARKGRNPKTGERIEVPPRRYVVFHPGAGLRARTKRRSDESPSS